MRQRNEFGLFLHDGPVARFAVGDHQLVLGSNRKRLVDQIAPHYKSTACNRCQGTQHLSLSSIQLSRLAVDHTQRTHPRAIGQDQRSASIETNVRFAHYHGITRKTRILRGVRNLEYSVGADGMRAKRNITRRLADSG